MAQTQPFKPFPIVNMRTGMALDLQPWLIPQDAFVNLENVYLYQGAIYKRAGYSLLQQMIHHEEVSLGTGNASNATFSGTLLIPVRPGDVTVSDTVETFTDDGEGVMAGDQGGTGTIDYNTGAISVTFNAAPTLAQDIACSYNYYPALPVIGLWNYISASGTEQLLAFDTRRINYWDDVYNKWVDPDNEDQFTAEDFQFPWVCNWQNVSYITNGIDRIKTYSDGTLNNFDVDFVGDGLNHVDYALYAFPFKDRLVILRTQEDGSGFFQRARWCVPGNPGNWKEDEGGGFVDAPTNDWIVAAGFLKDNLIVFFERSIWMLQYTGSYQLPFEWVRVVSQEGSISPLSLQEFSDEILAFGNTSIVGCDGQDTYDLADRLSNFVLAMNQEAVIYSYGGIDERRKQAWWSFPTISSDKPDKVMVYNYKDTAWSVFDIAMTCFGYFNTTSADDPTWDDMGEKIWDEVESIWDQREFQAGFPIMVGGDANGNVFRMNMGDSDNGAPIYAEILSGQWNPYRQQGQAATMGWVDFLVERDPDINLRVDFFADEEDAPYLNQMINLGGDNPDKSKASKVWVRADCGAEADSHQIRLSHNTIGKQFVIHAIIPYFRAGGFGR